MVSELIARLTRPLLDGLARALLRMGLVPNHITLLGLFLTLGAGVAVAMGRPFWRFWAVGLLVASGACDLLDGAMAKRGGLRSRFGAVLDSTCDRVGDAALYLGAAFYFIVRPDDPPGSPPNLTLALLAVLGLVWAYLISYVRARAANESIRADGGFWQRPERVVTLLLALAFHHLPTAVWLLGTLPLTSAAHRLWRAWRTVRAEEGGPAVPDEGPRGLPGIVLWRWRRGTLPFDVQAGAVIAAVVFLDLPAADLLREVAARLVGP